MLQEKLRLNKEERDIVSKAAIKRFNALINGYHPMLTVKKDPDCSYLKLQMDGFDELCYYILLDEYDDGTPFYLIYYGRLNWGGLPDWGNADKECDSLQEVGNAIAEHYANYVWNKNESFHFKEITMDRKKLEARIARLEKLIKEDNSDSLNKIKSALGQCWAAVKILNYTDLNGYIDDEDYDNYLDDVYGITQAIEMICGDLGIKNEWTYEELD